MIQGLLILIALFLFIAFIWGVKSVVAAIVSALGGDARPQVAALPRPLHAHRREALDALKEAGYEVISVGKIYDIFDGCGLTESNKSQSSVHGMEQTNEIAERDFTGLCFTNLVDFDALWGHRRDPEGYGKEIEKFDIGLGELLGKLNDDDLLMITADHGNDPTYSGTDHTREQVPLLMYSPSMKQSADIGEADSFGDIGATIADNFGVAMPKGTIGESLLDRLV